jgi:hypothetical protein
MKVYGASLHGTSKDLASATCADCHRSHKILDAKDPDSPTHHLNQAKTCAACHADGNRSPKMTPEHVKSVRAYFGSAHGFAITQAGLIHSATCGDCHGTHTVELHGNKGSPVDRARIPETCGKCHVGVLRVYVESIHGKPFQEGNTDVPVCTDCHRTHDIRSRLERVSSTYGTNVSKTCLRCHANTQYVNKYSFPGLRGETYQQSYHGAASKLGDPNVASCASCHEAHDIRKSTDPLSSVNPANMVKTCGKCHKVEDPSKPMAFGKIHLGLAEESHWLTSIIERIYFLIIGGSMLLYAVYMTGDFIRSRRRSRRKSAAA